MCRILYMDKCTNAKTNTEIHIALDNKKYIQFEVSYEDDPLIILNELCDLFTNLTLNVQSVAEDLKTLVHSNRIRAFYY